MQKLRRKKLRWEKRRMCKAIHCFIDQAKVRELQQHVEEEEAGAIKWGDKMVRERSS